MFVVRDYITFHGIGTINSKQPKDKGGRAFKKRELLLPPSGDVVSQRPPLFINLNSEVMRDHNEENTGANNSNGGDSYGHLTAEIIHLKSQLQHVQVTSKVFMHYLCVQGADDWPQREELDKIHIAYLRAADAKY